MSDSGRACCRLHHACSADRPDKFNNLYIARYAQSFDKHRLFVNWFFLRWLPPNVSRAVPVLYQLPLLVWGKWGRGGRKDGDLGEEKALKFQRNYMAECCFRMLTYWLSLWSENCTQKQCANSQRDMFYGEITPTWKYNRCAQVFVYVRVSVFHLLAG